MSLIQTGRRKKINFQPLSTNELVSIVIINMRNNILLLFIVVTYLYVFCIPSLVYSLHIENHK